MWWNEFADWLVSPEARPVVFAAVVLLVAIVVAGVLAGLVFRAALSAVLARGERREQAATIAALLDAAVEASVWNSLAPQEQTLAQRALGEADIRLRMLPVKDASLVADWAGYRLAEMKRQSATFGYRLDPVVTEFRERLVRWRRQPRRMRRIFRADLEAWRAENDSPTSELARRQDEWVAQEHHRRHADDAEPAAAATARHDVPAPPVPADPKATGLRPPAPEG